MDRPTLDELITAPSFTLGKALREALREDDPNAFIGECGEGNRVIVDGRFDFEYVAMRLQRILKEARKKQAETRQKPVP